MPEQILLKNTEENNLYLCFQIDDKTYALTTEKVMEILMLPLLNYPQKLPKFVAGILNYNNILLNVFDMRKILNFPAKKFEINNQIIIIKGEETLIAVIVDKVTDFYTVLNEKVQTITNTTFNNFVNSFCREGDKVINIVDVQSLEKFIKNIDKEETETNYRDYFPDDDKSKYILEKRSNDLALKSSLNISAQFYAKDKYLTFKLGEHVYCLNAEMVKEVISTKNYSITTIPYVPSFIKGVINLKGDFYTVFSLKQFIGIKSDIITDEEKMIVLALNDMKAVLLVDEIGHLLNISPDKLHSQNNLNLNKMFIKSEIYIDNKVYNILDMQRLLNDNRIFIGKE